MVTDFVSVHRDRDAQLSFKRQQLLNHALEDLKSNPHIIGIYLAGSLSKGNDDPYSDIDLHIIVRKGTKADFIAQKYERPTKWGRVLFFEGVPNSPVIVVHYDCFVKIDTWYHEQDELTPSIWLQGNKPLYDPEGLIRDVLKKTAEIKYQVTSQEVLQWRGKVFAYIHETYRSVMRDEMYYALSHLDRLRWMMAYGWYMEQGKHIDGPFGVWSKIEGPRSELNEWQLKYLADWDCSRNGKDIVNTVKKIAPKFLKLNDALSHLTGIEPEEELCKEIIHLVI